MSRAFLCFACAVFISFGCESAVQEPKTPEVEIPPAPVVADVYRRERPIPQPRFVCLTWDMAYADGRIWYERSPRLAYDPRVGHDVVLDDGLMVRIQADSPDFNELAQVIRTYGTPTISAENCVVLKWCVFSSSHEFRLLAGLYD